MPTSVKSTYSLQDQGDTICKHLNSIFTWVWLIFKNFYTEIYASRLTSIKNYENTILYESLFKLTQDMAFWKNILQYQVFHSHFALDVDNEQIISHVRKDLPIEDRIVYHTQHATCGLFRTCLHEKTFKLPKRFALHSTVQYYNKNMKMNITPVLCWKNDLPTLPEISNTAILSSYTNTMEDQPLPLTKFCLQMGEKPINP